jgi:molybdenum cofactor biosynthesis enzyme MoaA
LGVVSEEFLTDTEGFRQRFIHTKTGAGILLRMDHLFDKKPYKACLNCQYKHDCLEGILPLRLSNHGLLLPCLSKGVPEINMRAIIENRSESEFKKIINEIGGK